MFQPDEKMLKLEIYLIKYEFFNFMHLTQCPGNSYLRFYLFYLQKCAKEINQSKPTNKLINILYIYITLYE